MTFNFNISNHKLTLTSTPELYSGSENYYVCAFEFLTPDWEGLFKFAMFVFDGGAVIQPINDGVCNIPSEVLASSGKIFMGVFGYQSDGKGLQRISTNTVYLFVGQGGYDSSNAPQIPSPDLWEQYYSEMTKAGGFTQRAEEAAEGSKASAEASLESRNAACQALSDLLSIIGTDIATLVDGKIPSSQIPSIATTEIHTASSLSEMEDLQVQNGDICIRTDENKSYIYSGGWIFLVSPTDYASASGYAQSCGTAENASMINNHRLVEMSAEEFEYAVKDANTYYLVY